MTVSPARTGAGQFTSDIPGEPKLAASRRTASTYRRMQMQAVCQPEATMPPNIVRRPASFSRCDPCGSHSDANSTISSRETVQPPSTKTRQGTESSQWITADASLV